MGDGDGLEVTLQSLVVMDARDGYAHFLGRRLARGEQLLPLQLLWAGRFIGFLAGELEDDLIRGLRPRHG